jgi:uncharacterized protein YjbI with pentapeptide repeats
MQRVTLGGSLAGVDFEGVDLADSVFTELDGKVPDLSGAKLIGANLSRATMDDVLLEGASVDRVDFTMTGLRNVVIPEIGEGNRPMTLKGAELSHATLTGDLQSMAFDFATLERANLSGVTSLRGASFRGARLMGAALPDFTAETRPASFQGADLRGVRLAGDLDGVDFSGAMLRNAVIAPGTSLVGARFDCADLRGMKEFKGRLDPAHVQSAMMDSEHDEAAEKLRLLLDADRDRVLKSYFDEEVLAKTEGRFATEVASPTDCPTMKETASAGTSASRVEVVKQ